MTSTYTPILSIALVILILVIVVDKHSVQRAIYYALPVILLIGSITYLHMNIPQTTAYFIFTSFIVLCGVLFLIHMYMNEFTSSFLQTITDSPKWLWFIIGSSIAMAMIFPSMKQWSDSQTGVVGFILNLLLFIPCALRQSIQYLIDEFKIATNATWVLLLLEIMVVVIYFILPRVGPWILKQYYNNQSILIQEPRLLGHTNNFPSHQVIKQNKYFQHHPIMNYSLSCWIFQNESMQNGMQHSVINYGFQPHLQVKNNNLIVYSKDTELSRVDFPLQKWNHVVCVYTNNVCNLFINGERQSTTPVYTHTQINNNNWFPKNASVTIGDETKDGNGSIQLVQMFSHPLSLSEIKNIFQTQHLITTLA